MPHESDEKRAYEDYYNKQIFDSLKPNGGYDEQRDKLSANESDELRAYENEEYRKIMDKIKSEYPYR